MARKASEAGQHLVFYAAVLARLGLAAAKLAKAVDVAVESRRLCIAWASEWCALWARQRFVLFTWKNWEVEHSGDLGQLTLPSMLFRDIARGMGKVMALDGHQTLSGPYGSVM